MPSPKPNRDEEVWRKAILDGAYQTAWWVLERGCDYVARSRQGDLFGGRPTIEIQGVDGEWRRYFVRLTEMVE